MTISVRCRVSAFSVGLAVIIDSAGRFANHDVV
jgi:hypothetical protein